MGLKGKNNEEKIWRFLKSKGLTDAGTAGLMGNLLCESKLDPKNLQDSYQGKLGYTDDSYCKSVDDGSYKNFIRDCAGFGLAQWTWWARKKKLLLFARKTERSIGDLEMQLEFLYKELSEDYSSVLKTLKRTSSVSEASDSVLLKFECPYDQGPRMRNIRSNYGMDIYNRNKLSNPVGSDHKFKMRTTKPEAGNKYYITKSRGGYSDAIEGRPTDSDCNVLSNCVGYCVGRFNEIGGYGYCKYLRPVNAENFMQYASGLKIGLDPKEGACMVWQKGQTLMNSDGAGHVAIVEKVVNRDQIITSESGWNCKPFWNQTRNRGDGNWGMRSPYKFLGFIYNPAVGIPSGSGASSQINSRLLYAGCRGDDVKDVQSKLISIGYNIGRFGADGRFGQSTKAAVIKFQRDNDLAVDGIVGNDTYIALLEASKKYTCHNDTYKIRVNVDGLNIRQRAGTDSPVIGAITDRGVYEISGEEKGCGALSWLKLSGRPGYIASDYTIKL